MAGLFVLSRRGAQRGSGHASAPLLPASSIPAIFSRRAAPNGFLRQVLRVCFLGFFLVGCTSEKISDSNGRWIRWATEESPCSKEWTSQNPFLPAYSCLVSEGLATTSIRGEIPEKTFLESWAYQKPRWVLKLKTNSRWSDGSALTSHQVIESWKQVLTHCSQAPKSSLLFEIHGAEAFCRKRLPFSKVGLSAPDSLTLVVDGPSIWFPWALTHPVTFPFRSDNGAASLGPFLPPSPQHRGWRFRKNLLYFSSLGIEGLLIQKMPLLSRIEAFLSGETDFVDGLSNQTPSLLSDPRLASFPTETSWVLLLNPLFLTSSDRALLLETIDRKETPILTGFPLVPDSYVNLAKNTLHRPNPLLFSAPKDKTSEELLQNIQMQWLKKLGIRSERVKDKDKTMLDLGSYDFDPSAPLQKWRYIQRRVQKTWGKENAMLSEIIRKHSLIETISEASSLSASCLRPLEENGIGSSLWRTSVATLVQSNITGLKRGSLGRWDFREVRRD